MNPPVRNTHLRIDFVIREVCDDGTVGEDDLRFIRFGDDVPTHQAKDFFDRCGHAVGLMFKPDGPYFIAFAGPPPNKINTIKVVRELTWLGLKEAKDIVEAPSGTQFLSVKNYDDLRHVVRLLEETGAKVEVRSNFTSPNRTGMPQLVEYVRRP